MADEQRPSGPPGGKRRRPPTTLDLKATEVARDPVKPAETTDADQKIASAEAPAAAAAAAAPNADTASPPGWRPNWVEARMARIGARLAAGSRGRLIAAAAAAAAAAMLVLFLALWGLGAFNNRDDALPARIAALETQMRDIAARPAPASVDPRALAELAARLTKLEQAAAVPRAPQPDQALTDRVAALETAVRPLADFGQRLDAAGAAAREAKSRADAVFEAAQKGAPAQAADRQEIEALAQRVAALEQAAKSADEKIARAATSVGADRAGRLAFVASALRAAVERGEPFAPELAAAKSLIADPAALSPLEPFAVTGVPRAETLARELSQRSNAILAAAGNAPREGGILDRLQQNAERLVRVRPISEMPGDDPATVLARAEAKASHGDIPGAVKDLAQLPEPARAAAQAWMKKAEAQVAALAAARGLAENAVGALAR